MTYCLNYYENKLIAVFILKLKLLHYRNRCTAQAFWENPGSSESQRDVPVDFRGARASPQSSKKLGQVPINLLFIFNKK